MLFINGLTFGFDNCFRAQYKSCRCQHTVAGTETHMNREQHITLYIYVRIYLHKNRIKVKNIACNTHMRPGLQGLGIYYRTSYTNFYKSLHLRGLKTKKSLKNYKLQLDMFLRYCSLFNDMLPQLKPSYRVSYGKYEHKLLESIYFPYRKFPSSWYFSI